MYFGVKVLQAFSTCSRQQKRLYSSLLVDFLVDFCASTVASTVQIADMHKKKKASTIV